VWGLQDVDSVSEARIGHAAGDKDLEGRGEGQRPRRATPR
jgi:hypothetical protein